jgi:hypothetical protein
MNRTSAESTSAESTGAVPRAPGQCRIAAALLVGCLSVSAANALVAFEDTELTGWSTRVSGLLDRTVSGAPQPTGGNSGAYYLVRHSHQRFIQYSTTVVSASLSPRALDPAEIGLADAPRLSADLLFEAGDGNELPPTLYWTVVLQQGEVLYSYPNPANETITRQNAFVRVDAELLPDRWRPLASAPGLPPSPSLSPGAAPVRLGLLLQSDVVVPPGQQREVRIRIDNVRLETVGEVPLPRVSLVAVPSPEGGHVVFAPPECFDGSVGPYEIYVGAEADRDLEGCVGFRAPNLTSAGSFGQFCFAQGDRSAGVDLACQDDPPGEIELLTPDQGAALGVPSLARVEPCLVRVAGGDLTCNELRDVCVVEVLVGLVCHLRPPGDAESVFCFSDFDSRQRSSVGARSARADSHAATDALETLRRLRDEVMAATAAGRYYRDLYEAYSPELRELLLGDLRIVRDALAAAPPWIAALAELVDGGGAEAIVTSAMVADMLAIFDRFESSASPTLRELFRSERARLRLADMAGRSIEDAFALVEERGAPAACATSDTALCLQGGRFRVEVTWTDFEDRSGAGHAVPLSSDSGYFWFFNRENIELGLKVLDGRTINGRFWVFYGALSNVEYSVLVTDTATGAVRVYHNPSRVFASVGDTSAFVPDGAPRAAAENGENGIESTMLGRMMAVAPGADLSLASGLDGRATCLSGANALCLTGNRFRVEVEWRDFRGGTGFGTARPLTSDTGSFWFFNQENTELFIKVLDARSVNDHFWVFYGALSNVEFTIRVTDTATGAVRTYRNPSGTFASRGDVEAF